MTIEAVKIGRSVIVHALSDPGRTLCGRSFDPRIAKEDGRYLRLDARDSVTCRGCNRRRVTV